MVGRPMANCPLPTLRILVEGRHPRRGVRDHRANTKQRYSNKYVIYVLIYSFLAPTSGRRFDLVMMLTIDRLPINACFD